MQNKMRECLALEAQHEALRMEIVEAMRQQITNCPTSGKKISDKPRVFTVNFASLTSWNLSPEYYDQDEQARIVSQKLESATSMGQMIKHMREMVETKKVKIGSTNYHLNEQTIQVLHRFELSD